MIYADRQYNISWNIPGNVNRSDLTICWVQGPYNLVGNNVLTINFSLLFVDNPQAQKYYSAIDITLPSSASVTAQTIIDALNANPQFFNWFEALPYGKPNGAPTQVMIRSRPGRLGIRFYFSNTGAETIMRFNQKAPVRPLPSYYMRHTIENAPVYSDSVGMLIYLDPDDPVDAEIITNAGYDPTYVAPDWELLGGRAEDFKFELNEIDGSGRITETIEFFAGGEAGDMARKTYFVYTGANTTPSQTYQIPYVLTYVDVANIPPFPS